MRGNAMAFQGNLSLCSGRVCWIVLCPKSEKISTNYEQAVGTATPECCDRAPIGYSMTARNIIRQSSNSHSFGTSIYWGREQLDLDWGLGISLAVPTVQRLRRSQRCWRVRLRNIWIRPWLGLYTLSQRHLFVEEDDDDDDDEDRTA